MRPPGDDSSQNCNGPLEDTLFVFECEAQPQPPTTVSSNLFEVAPAVPVHPEQPAPLSRIEATQARRQRKRAAPMLRLAARAAAWRDRLGQRLVRIREGMAAGATDASRRALKRTITRLRQRTQPTPVPRFTATAFEYQESNGFVVAVLLGMAVVGYGSFLLGSWRTSGVRTTVTTAAAGTTRVQDAPPVVVTSAVAPPRPAIHVRNTPAANTGVLNPLAGIPRAAVTRPVSYTPTAGSLTSLWQRRDTRSLDQAFNSLRHQTLAFHRCGMRVLDTNRAVARCEGVTGDGTQASRAAVWTIEFQRKAGRWVMARVTAR